MLKIFTKKSQKVAVPKLPKNGRSQNEKNGPSSQDVTCVTVCVPMAVEESRGDRSDISASKTDHTPYLFRIWGNKICHLLFSQKKNQIYHLLSSLWEKIKSKFEGKNQKFKKKAHQESGWNPPSRTFMLLDLFECQPKFLRLQLYKYEIHLMLRSWMK